MGEHTKCSGTHHCNISYDGDQTFKKEYPCCDCLDEVFFSVPAGLNPDGVKELVEAVNKEAALHKEQILSGERKGSAWGISESDDEYSDFTHADCDCDMCKALAKVKA